jgi:DNA topoisomerase I
MPQADATSAADARAAGLRWTTDSTPGIARRRCGPGFMYVRPDGSAIGDKHTLGRIRSLVIPPAWKRVWICERADGHLQASGYDDRGRKQYRYHDEWRRIRDENKFGRLATFARALPRLRARVTRDIAQSPLQRTTVLATIVRLLDTTGIRIGNAEYARTNKSFGLTTLHDRHVTCGTTRIRFRFVGKGGKLHEVDVTDRRVARVVRSCQDLPGQELFQYVDSDGAVQRVDSSDVNDYLREVTGEDFSAKDFRTWSATVLAAQVLAARPPCDTPSETKQAIVETVKEVARELRNTPAVCRRSYIHPGVIAAFQGGVTIAAAAAGRGRKGVVERAVIRLLSAGTTRKLRKAG